MAERRKLFRSRMFKGAKLFLGTSSVLDCLVRDLNSSGARLQIPNTADLPERLTMTFDGGRTLRACRIVWRKPNETGLEFIR
jgi:hypothetical protein